MVVSDIFIDLSGRPPVNGIKPALLIPVLAEGIADNAIAGTIQKKPHKGKGEKSGAVPGYGTALVVGRCPK
jgi:hypothetical protein